MMFYYINWKVTKIPFKYLPIQNSPYLLEPRCSHNGHSGSMEFGLGFYTYTVSSLFKDLFTSFYILQHLPFLWNHLKIKIKFWAL